MGINVAFDFNTSCEKHLKRYSLVNLKKEYKQSNMYSRIPVWYPGILKP